MIFWLDMMFWYEIKIIIGCLGIIGFIYKNIMNILVVKEINWGLYFLLDFVCGILCVFI